MQFIIGVATSVGLMLLTIAVCVAIEQFSAIERYPLKARLPGIVFNLAGAVGSIAVIWPVQQAWRAINPGAVMVVPLWQWLRPLGPAALPLQWLALVLVADFLIYWRHRAEHRWFWTIHAVHHAPRELHAANDIGHPLQILFTLVFVSIPMCLIQIDGPATPFVIGFVVTLLSYYIHSPIDVHFGPLRKVLVDNRFHRIHHSLEPRHHDKNFGICFSIWDRMFGTVHEPADGEWPEVGVEGIVAPRSVKEYLLLPATFARRDAPVDAPAEATRPVGAA